MTYYRCARVCIPAVLVLTVTSGCLKPKPKPVQSPAPLTITAPPEAPVKAPMVITASADTNPDATGRPSPVVLRIYQLRTDAKFNGAEFFALYDDDKKVLGEERISVDEFVLAPSEQQKIQISVAPEARFVGAVAAFRDIRNAQWRVLIPASRKGLTVAVEKARVTLSAAN